MILKTLKTKELEDFIRWRSTIAADFTFNELMDDIFEQFPSLLQKNQNKRDSIMDILKVVPKGRILEIREETIKYSDEEADEVIVDGCYKFEDCYI